MLFVDDLIRAIVKIIQKWIRVKKATKWPLLEGKILKDQLVEQGYFKCRPSVEYTYTINGQAFYGSAVGYAMRKEDAEKLADRLVAGNSLVVRFNFADPYESRMLNRDNPEFPFGIDV